MNTNGVPVFDLAAAVYPRVFRTDLSQPGFALIDLGPLCGSQLQRRIMVELKRELDQLERKSRGRCLVYQSLGRFDQQLTTRPHRDGGPDESVLMLGYEPSPLSSHVLISDFSKCADEKGISPAEFLERFNPMLSAEADQLAAFTNPVPRFDHRRFQILLINNSLAAPGDGRLIGVLHTAEVTETSPAGSGEVTRIVNSTMIGSMPIGAEEPVTDEEQREFTTTDLIRRLE